MDFSYILAFIAALILGIGKGGIKGTSVLAVTLMVLAFGAKSSTGIILPLLITGDILAVIYFKKYTKWKYLINFLPWMLVGVVTVSYTHLTLPTILLV